MGRPKLSKTIDAILESRGVARLRDALTGVRSDNAVESPSSSTIATDTMGASENTKVPTTSAEPTSTVSSEQTVLIPLTEFLVSTLLLGPRPLPEFNFNSPGGEFLRAHSQATGVTTNELLEHMVSWGYRLGANIGYMTLEELALFYRDNKPEWWFG